MTAPSDMTDDAAKIAERPDLSWLATGCAVGIALVVASFLPRELTGFVGAAMFLGCFLYARHLLGNSHDARARGSER